MAVNMMDGKCRSVQQEAESVCIGSDGIKEDIKSSIISGQNGREHTVKQENIHSIEKSGRASVNMVKAECHQTLIKLISGINEKSPAKTDQYFQEKVTLNPVKQENFLSDPVKCEQIVCGL